MSEYDYDLFVVGAGSGGVRAARVASELGARVAVAELGRLGGTCVNVGCVPKKLFVYGSHFAYDLRDARGYGWGGEPSFDWATLRDNKDREIARLNGIYGGLLERGWGSDSGRARDAGGRARSAAWATSATRPSESWWRRAGGPFVRRSPAPS